MPLTPPVVPPPLPAPPEQAKGGAPPAPPDAISEDNLWEEVNGQRREKPMSSRAAELATLLATRLMMFALPRQLGRAVTEAIFLLDAATRLQRRPDVGFVSTERWPLSEPAPVGDPWPVIPDLAVEVISPSNTAEEVLDKILEYFRAGVRLVWVVYPKQQMVYVYESPVRVQGLTATDELTGGPVLPELRLPVAAVFDFTRQT
jgi:Uma2 family endonuclease